MKHKTATYTQFAGTNMNHFQTKFHMLTLMIHLLIFNMLVLTANVTLLQPSGWHFA